MTDKKKNLVVYILTRIDLPSLNAGKAMAQIHHAGVQMMSKYSKSAIVKEYISLGLESKADHFNTTLVLSATKDHIDNMLQKAKKLKDVECDKIVDPTYPFLVPNDEIAVLMKGVRKYRTLEDGRVIMLRKEMTCAWFLGNKNDETFAELFKEFNLHP